MGVTGGTETLSETPLWPLNDRYLAEAIVKGASDVPLRCRVCSLMVVLALAVAPLLGTQCRGGARRQLLP